jgi:hypothetical protein
LIAVFMLLQTSSIQLPPLAKSLNFEIEASVPGM